MTAWIIDRDHPSKTLARIILGVLAIAPLFGLAALWLS